MKKTGLTLTVVVLAVSMISGCREPHIEYTDISGFRHETSVSIPFDPMEDTSAILYIGNNGTAVFVKPNTKYLGNVNPDSEFCPEIYTVERDGTRELLQPGILKAWIESRDGQYLAGAGGKYTVFFIDIETLKVEEVMDQQLCLLLQATRTDCFSDKMVSFAPGLSSTSGFERFIGLYDIRTGKDTIFNLKENYLNIDGIDYYGENLLAAGTRLDDIPPDLYILNLDGSIKLKMPVDFGVISNYIQARFISGGFVLYTGRKYVDSRLTAYSMNGTAVWEEDIPVTGIPVLKRVMDGENELLMLCVRSADDEQYIGCFHSDNGSKTFTDTLYDRRSVFLTEEPAFYYLHPQWSYYPEIVPPNGIISCFDHDKEIARVNIFDGIYYFAASPDGNFFAVVTDNTLSIFSISGERNIQ